MPKPLTLLLGGQMAAPHADYLKQHLNTDWNIVTWIEGEPFEDFAALVPTADAFIGGFIIISLDGSFRNQIAVVFSDFIGTFGMDDLIIWDFLGPDSDQGTACTQNRSK